MARTALITGATSGIGRETARLLANSGLRVIICGRREERLVELERELKVITDVFSLTFDVRDNEKVVDAVDNLPGNWKDIDVLINCAGNAHGMDSIEKGDVNDWDAMLDINVKGLLYVTKAILKGMVERKAGHIVNIGSIAGKEVYPNGNIYCASKFAVDAISNSMRIDLNKFGIKVSSINPGLVQTEFSEVRFKGDKERAKSVYEGFVPLTASDIAEVILFAVTRPFHVNISDLNILPTAQANATLVNKSY